MVGWLDIVLAVIVLGTLVAGLVKGLIKEAVGVAAALGGFLLAARWYKPVAAWLEKSFVNPVVSKLLGFILVLVAVVLAGVLIAAILSKIMVGPLKLANHLLGGVFGLFEGLLICGALVFALMVFPVDRAPLAASRLAPYCFGLAKTMVALIPPELKVRFKSAYQEIVKSESVDGKKI